MAGITWITAAGGPTAAPAPGGTGWRTTDLSSIVTDSAASAVLMLCRNPNLGTDYNYGWRKTGQSHDRRNDISGSGAHHSYFMCGLNARQVDLYYENTGLEYYVVGWADADTVVWLDTAVDVTPVGVGFIDIDISAQVTGACSAAIVSLECSVSDRAAALRKNGSSDVLNNSLYYLGQAIVGVDSGCVYEATDSTGNVTHMLEGYFVGGLDWYTNAVDVSPTGTAWGDLATLQNAAATGALYQGISSVVNKQWGLRIDGGTDTKVGMPNRAHDWGFCPSASRIIEARVLSTDVDIYENADFVDWTPAAGRHYPRYGHVLSPQQLGFKRGL